jgi:hypothetical protein
MRKLFTTMMVGIVFLMLPVLAIGATFTGSVQGFNCVTQGKICPIGMEDPMIAAENVFVLLVDAKKGEWYFVPNVDRGILARHINTEIRIVGDVNMKLKSIHAQELYMRGPGNTWKKSWSVDMQDAIEKDLFGGFGRGGLTGP